MTKLGVLVRRKEERETQVRVILNIGEGWDPFTPIDEDEDPLAEMPAGVSMDPAEATIRIREAIVKAVAEEIPGVEMTIAPADEDGNISMIEIDDEDEEKEDEEYDRIGELIGADVGSLANPGVDGVMILKDGIDNIAMDIAADPSQWLNAS